MGAASTRRFSAKSGRGLPDSKTLRAHQDRREDRQVLECASLLALSGGVCGLERIRVRLKGGRRARSRFLANAFIALVPVTAAVLLTVGEVIIFRRRHGYGMKTP